ncbi:hypothetical protein BMMON2_13950 [Burkholderia mallei]
MKRLAHAAQDNRIKTDIATALREWKAKGASERAGRAAAMSARVGRASVGRALAGVKAGWGGGGLPRFSLRVPRAPRVRFIAGGMTGEQRSPPTRRHSGILFSRTNRKINLSN